MPSNKTPNQSGRDADAEVSMVTQCPNCTTRFKVTNAQLQVAAGKVRCGACLSVFDGTSTLLLDGEPFTHPEARLDDDAHDLDQLLDELSQADVAETEDETGIAEDLSDAAMLPMADETQIHEAPPDNQLTDMQGSEELAELEAQLMQELQGEAPATKQPQIFDTPEAALDHGQEEHAGDEEELVIEADSLDRQTSEEPESHSNEHIGELAEPRQFEHLPEADSLAEETIEILPPSQGDSTIEAANEPFGGESIEEVELQSSHADTNNLVANEGQDEDEVLFGESSRKRRKPIGTFVLIVVALMALGAQILYFQFDAWSKDQQFRPIYQTICNVTGCKLPVMKDVSQIVSRRSITRAHPDNPGVRVVDVLMVNNASFSQPFPLIELTFNNLNGKMVAGRRFKPEDYLSGDMSPGDLMAPRTPIHVSLQLQDPGPDAQSFRVVFR